MSVLDASVEIVEPTFDRPESTEPLTTPLLVGTRVSLVYRGSPLPLQVESIERLGTSFVGRIRDAAADMPLVRFRPKDVASID
ncbi:MAG: hypothetical protein OEN23_04825 [Paracoccaceae bacterium]|nr:hypothetical protein [Paracoccaceae bacterium]